MEGHRDEDPSLGAKENIRQLESKPHIREGCRLHRPEYTAISQWVRITHTANALG